MTSDSEPALACDKRSSIPPVQPGTTDSNVCVCGQQSKIDNLIEQNEMLTTQSKKLKSKLEESNMRCLRLTDSLNLKLMLKPQEVVFTETEGFPDKEKLKKISEAASSDYVFVKLLMHNLWPDGFRRRTVTGRSSNNPHGRVGGQTDQANEPSAKIPLEPEKVSYVEDRLEEHRLYQGDTPAVARVKAKECGRYMARLFSYYGKK
ncbi:uncharacterized protein LOC135705847 [Ochlerotatus camptorhynchus]|uniref:uncharacterized protein LOC135705847 n=1 Tax=Ochlerotatus camptorhynchus TaxID=644619 RepID=UPI0031DA8E41